MVLSRNCFVLPRGEEEVVLWFYLASKADLRCTHELHLYHRLSERNCTYGRRSPSNTCANQDTDKIQRTTDHGWWYPCDSSTPWLLYLRLREHLGRRCGWIIRAKGKRMSVVMQCLLYMTGSYTRKNITTWWPKEDLHKDSVCWHPSRDGRNSQKVPHLHESYMQLTAAKRGGLFLLYFFWKFTKL